MIFRRTRERFWAVIASMIPVHLAYWVAIRVIGHAAMTAFSERPTASITGLEAIRYWHESNGLAPMARFTGARLRPRQRSTPADGEPAIQMEELDIEEDPEQVRLVEGLLRPG